MDSLIAELERATEGSRELDSAISITTLVIWGPGALPHYTTSLDAALTLVLEGWVWSVQTDYELPGRARLSTLPPGIDSRPLYITADAATPALAVNIASLKARQAMKDAA